MLCINSLSTDAAKQVFILVGHAVPSLLKLVVGHILSPSQL
jgi:hypothetical protein